ncbi:MAG: hypothetical protein AAF740_07620, partial [Bacteroidota bacterium]
MLRLLSILLLSLILAQPFAKFGVIVTFQLSQERIAAQLCEQREQQENTCQGYCQLEEMLAAVELQKQHEEHQNLPQELKDKVEHLFCYTPILELDETPQPLKI